MSRAQGQDRSVYQPVTGWDGCGFGIVKASQGTGLTDATFARNWAALGRAGIPRGAYHYLDTGDPAGQAQHFHAVVKAQGLKAGDMLWCDSEIACAGADAATHAFLVKLAALVPAGVIVGTYTNHAAGQSMKTTARDFPELWFAWPSADTDLPVSLHAPWTTWRIWQKSFTGRLDGGGDVDVDVYNGSQGDLLKWLHPSAKIRHWHCLGNWSLDKEASEHKTTPEEMLALAKAEGHVYGPAMTRYIRRGDFAARLPSGTTLYAPDAGP